MNLLFVNDNDAFTTNAFSLIVIRISVLNFIAESPRRNVSQMEDKSRKVNVFDIISDDNPLLIKNRKNLAGCQLGVPEYCY
jgi:hypothetical protein